MRERVDSIVRSASEGLGSEAGNDYRQRKDVTRLGSDSVISVPSAKEKAVTQDSGEKENVSGREGLCSQSAPENVVGNKVTCEVTSEEVNGDEVIGSEALSILPVVRVRVLPVVNEELLEEDIVLGNEGSGDKENGKDSVVVNEELLEKDIVLGNEGSGDKEDGKDSVVSSNVDGVVEIVCEFVVCAMLYMLKTYLLIFLRIYTFFGCKLFYLWTAHIYTGTI